MITGTYAGEIAESARAVLERETPRDQLLSRLRSEPLSSGAWRAAAEVGWFRLLTSEAAGGLEAGPAEVAALFREVGRHLPAGPFAETVVAAGLLRSQADLGPDERVITFGELPAGTVSSDFATGRADFLEYADLSDVLLLRVELGATAAIAWVDPRGEGVAVTPLPGFDLVGRPCRVELEKAPVEVIAEGAAATALLEQIEVLRSVAALGELQGLAAEVVDMSVQYAKDRVQFDRPIGSFQAVQHRLAEMAVTLGAIASSADAGVALAAGAGPEARAGLDAIHALAAELARELVLSALQVHGGIGFTDEHRLHVYLKRALRLQALADRGDPLAAMGARLLAGAS